MLRFKQIYIYLKGHGTPVHADILFHEAYAGG